MDEGLLRVTKGVCVAAEGAPWVRGGITWDEAIVDLELNDAVSATRSLPWLAKIQKKVLVRTTVPLPCVTSRRSLESQ